MISTRARFLALALFWGLPTAIPAQPADDTLRVPAAALSVLEIPTDGSPMAMLRVIRVLHALPRRGDPTGPVLDFERLLDGLDRLERELSRTGERGIAVAMAANSADRDALRNTLVALGLRIREQRGVFTVEPGTGVSDKELRTLLLKAGIDTAAIQARLNTGETVHVAPPSVDVPLPIPFETWLSDVFDNRMSSSRLFSAIIRSRDASLLLYGVQTMTPDTRAFLVKTPGLVQWLHGRAPIVAAFGSAFRVAGGRAVMPGGAEAEELWETLADEKLIRPDRFVRALFSRDGGRLAYFANTLWTLDEAHARFALGLWIGDRRLRQERFDALYQVFAQIDPSWSLTDSPFHRPAYDASLLLSNLRLTDAGLLAAPAYRRLWERGVNGIELPDAGDRQMREPAEDGVADAALLAGLLNGKLHERRVTIERIDAGQRIFRDAADVDMQDVLVALRAYGRYPAAVLALERIGIRKPAIYAQIARRVAAIEAVDSTSAVPLLAQFQGALAILERMSRTAAIPAPTIEQLATSLIAVSFEDGQYRGGVAEWLRTQLVPALPGDAAQTVDERLLDTLVDRFRATTTFSWEGEDYVVDPGRLRREVRSVREKQKGNSLDNLLAVYRHVAAITATGLTLDTLKARSELLRADAAKLLPARPWPDAPDAVPNVAKVVDRALKELAGVRKQTDINKTVRIVRPMVDALDYLLGETLVAVAYAVSMGDTGRGPAAAVDLSHRHLFGLANTVGDARRLVPWQRPTRGSASGLGDTVTGSVTGIDLALSKTRLRRLTAELPESPRLNGNDRDTMTDTVALLNPRDLDDADASQIASALKRGRARVEQAAGDSRALDALAIEVRLDASRHGLLDWTARHLSSSVIGLFSLGELFRLGGGTPGAVRGWGTSHEALTGCLCVQFPDDAAFELAVGRPSTGQLGARVAELNLRIAELLSDLRVPAALFPGVMALATQDFVDSLPLLYPDDWAAITGHALALSRERVEDYVSAVVASGPVRTVEETGAR